MNKKTVFITIGIAFIELTVIILGYCYTRSLSMKITQLSSELTEKIENLENEINSGFDATNEHIRDVQNNTSAQFSETARMSKTYGKILEEQKKQRVDTVSRDSALIEKKKLGESYYKAKEYKKSYEIFSEILTYQGDDADIRFKKMTSLFNMNKMDSSKYKEILNDCNILKNKGATNPEIDEIERFIKTETKGKQQ